MASLPQQAPKKVEPPLAKKNRNHARANESKQRVLHVAPDQIWDDSKAQLVCLFAWYTRWDERQWVQLLPLTTTPPPPTTTTTITTTTHPGGWAWVWGGRPMACRRSCVEPTKPEMRCPEPRSSGNHENQKQRTTISTISTTKIMIKMIGMITTILLQP